MGRDEVSDDETVTEETTSSLSDEQQVGESRFSKEDMEAFNTSSEGKGLIASFFLTSMFYMWPYQTLLQTQNFLTAEFPDMRGKAGFVMMLCTTWPLLLSHSFLSFTGLSRRLPYMVKMAVPPLLVVAIAIYLLILMAFSTSENLLLYSLYAAAFTVSLAESITEPATYDMAGLMPSSLTSQAVQAGNGACGVVVCCVQIATRLAFNGLGEIGKEELEALTYVFFVLMACSGICLALVYLMKIRRSTYYGIYVENQGTLLNSNSDKGNGDDDAINESVLQSMWQAVFHVWPSMLSIVVTFGLTLALWPVIPGLTCVSSPSSEDHTLQTWWFDITLITFNVADFIGKFESRSLSWGARRLSPMTQLGLSLIRAVIFIPLMLSASAPQAYSPSTAKWVSFFSVFFLGLTNGWLSTVSFMRAPKALPAGTSNAVAEQASTLLVIGLFVGLSGGCTVAYALGETVLREHLGVCFSGGA